MGDRLRFHLQHVQRHACGSFGALQEKIARDFGATPQSAFDAVLRRLERDTSYSPVPSAQVVPRVMALLNHARQGLTGAELATLLQMDLTGSQITGVEAREAVELVLRQARWFLARREGGHVFFYESASLAIRRRYAAKISVEGSRPAEAWHGLLSDYFDRLPPGDRRRLAELPYHLALAGDTSPPVTRWGIRVKAGRCRKARLVGSPGERATTLPVSGNAWTSGGPIRGKQARWTWGILSL